MRRRAVLATFGSLGDLHPFIALALALKKTGIDPVIAGAEEYRGKIEAAGIEFFPVRPSFAQVEHDLGMTRSQLTRRAIARSDFLFRRLALPYLRAGYEDMMLATAGAQIVLTSSLAFGARLAAEKRGIDWFAVVLQPMMFFSAHDPPVMPQAPWIGTLLRRLGPRLTASLFSAMRRGLRGMFAPVNELRAEIGLPPTRKHPFFDGQYSSAGAIALYSGLLGQIESDFPSPSVIAGFASFDSEDGCPPVLPAELDRWLETGEAPLVFTLGSMFVNSAGNFYSESAAAAASLRRRAVLLVGEGYVERSAHLHSRDVFVCAYAPHSLLFARAAAVIHHGGVGTLAQAMRAGKPQLIVPIYGDQMDNAVRAVRLNIARLLRPSRYCAARAAGALGQLLASGEVIARAREVKAALEREDGAVCAAAIIAQGGNPSRSASTASRK